MNNKFLSLTAVSLLALTTIFGSFSALAAENISKTSVAATSGNGTVKNAISDIDFESGFSADFGELKTDDNGNKYLALQSEQELCLANGVEDFSVGDAVAVSFDVANTSSESKSVSSASLDIGGKSVFKINVKSSASEVLYYTENGENAFENVGYIDTSAGTSWNHINMVFRKVCDNVTGASYIKLERFTNNSFEYSVGDCAFASGEPNFITADFSGEITLAVDSAASVAVDNVLVYTPNNETIATKNKILTFMAPVKTLYTDDDFENRVPEKSIKSSNSPNSVSLSNSSHAAIAKIGNGNIYALPNQNKTNIVLNEKDDMNFDKLAIGFSYQVSTDPSLYVRLKIGNQYALKFATMFKIFKEQNSAYNIEYDIASKNGWAHIFFILEKRTFEKQDRMFVSQLYINGEEIDVSSAADMPIDDLCTPWWKGGDISLYIQNKNTGIDNVIAYEPQEIESGFESAILSDGKIAIRNSSATALSLNNKKLIAAAFDDEDKLVSIKITNLNVTVTSKEVADVDIGEFDFPSQTEYVKIFAWSDMDSMTPVLDNETIFVK